MKKILLIFIYIASVTQTQALQISEVMSNPTGDDSGREWIEVYNNTQESVDLTGLTISIKGGNAVTASSVSGGTVLPANGYAIIGSTVTGATKFLQDYPLYNGLLLKSSISLVNTGVTSIDIRMNGSIGDSLQSYTAAKEGSTFSLLNGSFVAGTPTPGSSNQASSQENVDSSPVTQTTSSTTETQATVAQMSPPNADITLYLPHDKIVVAGAETVFTVGGMTRAGNPIDKLLYTWAFGDGGQATGSSTKYRYVYPGVYIVQTEGTNGYVSGTGRMRVRVVAPDIEIRGVQSGKYGTYLDILNPNNYELDFSQWQLSIDGNRYYFPKNTLLAGNVTTHISGVAMGFASTTISEGMIIKILFPNTEEVIKYIVPHIINDNFLINSKISPPTQGSTSLSHVTNDVPRNNINRSNVSVSTTNKKTGNASTSGIILHQEKNKDTRLISFFKTLFH